MYRNALTDATWSSQRDALFGGTKVFFLDRKVFLGVQNVFSEYKKLFLTFWKVESGRGGVGDPRSSRTEKAKYSSTNKQCTKNNRNHEHQENQRTKKNQTRKKSNKSFAFSNSSFFDLFLSFWVCGLYGVLRFWSTKNFYFPKKSTLHPEKSFRITKKNFVSPKKFFISPKKFFCIPTNILHPKKSGHPLP